MKIIIVGAGQVGRTLTDNLVRENNDITVIDIDLKRLQDLQSRFDIRTVHGFGSYPTILKQAGATSADMLIAVSNSDETNIVACQVAHTLFHVPQKIARIRSRYYLTHEELFDAKAIPIDVRISPEAIVTRSLKQLIDNPCTLQVLNFSDDTVQLISVKIADSASIIGKSLRQLHEINPEVATHIAAIFREKQMLPLTMNTLIQKNDEVFFIVQRNESKKIMRALGFCKDKNKRIMIAGGGNIGASLAKEIEKNYNVKLIEHNALRTQRLAEELNNTTVLLGDSSDKELLINENIENIDVFCAVTNNDEANIMSCLLARRLGVASAMTLVTQVGYTELLEEGHDIDIVISPQQITIGTILKHIRRGDITNVYSLRRGAAEVIEITAHGDERTSKAVGQFISEVKIPDGVTIGAIVRKGKIIMPYEEIRIEPEDHVIVFLSVKKHLKEVERLFEVSATYL